jgi:hypothetical protein
VLLVVKPCSPKVRLAAERLTAGAVPVPDSAIVWGLPAALSVIVTIPVLVPVALGVNVTGRRQLAPASSELPQVLASAKSPVTAIPLIQSALVPVLLIVTDWAGLVVSQFCQGKVNVRLERETTGAVPVPNRVTLCGLPAALSVIVTAAFRAPTAVGVKVTLIVQLAFGATGLPAAQVVPVASAKSPALAPVNPTLVKVRFAVPLLVTVTVCAALVVVTTCAGKFRLAGARTIPGAVPVPVRGTVWGLP